MKKNELHIKANDLNKNDKLLIETFSQYYINIAKRIPGSRSTCMEKLSTPDLEK